MTICLCLIFSVPLYSLLAVNENIIVSGDDDGELKVSDVAI